MLHFDYEGALRSLSSAERKKGQALRIPRCVRGAHEGEVSWVVLHFCMQNDSVALPEVRGFLSLRDIKSTVFGPITSSLASLKGGSSWYVREFEVVLPLSLRTFVVSCGDSSLRMTWRKRSGLLDMHYEEIAHAATDASYSEWFYTRGLTKDVDIPSMGPLMSIVTPVYQTPPDFLAEMIESVLGQSYDRWELIVVNASPDDEGVSRVLSLYRDSRIVVVDHPENDGISGNTNVGLEVARGDYVSFLDHDDVIEPNALALMVDAIGKADERIDLLYCDEDSIDEKGIHRLPLFKPCLNLDLLYSNNYVIHWLTVSREVLQVVDRSSRAVDGAQDYDLTLKVFETSKNILRIPRVLYHWRIHSGSTNMNPGSKPYAQRAGAKAIAQHFSRLDLRASVFLENDPFTYRSIFEFPQDGSCSVVCLASCSRSMETLRCAAVEYEQQSGSPCAIILLESDAPNQVERSLASAGESLVLLCNFSVSQIDVGSLAVMAGYFQRSDVAAVSPKVIRRDGLIDFAGACVCPDGDVMCLNRFLPASDGGYIGRAQRPYDGFVVNPECFMTRKSLLLEFLGSRKFNDDSQWGVNFFAECYKKGLRCVYTPFACLHDMEHKTLLDYGVGEFTFQDRTAFERRYGELFSTGDPSHNPNFDPFSPYYRLRQ